MTSPDSRLPRGARQARLMRMGNVPMRFLLGLPFATPLSKRLMLVFHIGRKTGRCYRQPVSYVAHDDVLLSPGGGRWTRNLTGEPVRLRLRGRDRRARAELVDDPGEVDRLFAVMSAQNPMLRRFVPIPMTPDGHLQPEALQVALRQGFRIVRWHPLPETAGRNDERAHHE
jgi:deazaflavin-dependent oxidoreductase (nitroreductase family)